MARPLKLVLACLASAPLFAVAQSPAPAAPPKTSPHAELVVQLLDVGQGDATYIVNGTSRVLIDGGPDANRYRRVLDSLGIRDTVVDVVILTHQHDDHYNGLRVLFETSRNLKIKYFFEIQTPTTRLGLLSLRDSIIARVKKGELIYRRTDDPCANGAPTCTITLNGGARMHILRPPPKGNITNNRSVAVKLVAPDSAAFTMWLAGDAERHEIAAFGREGYQKSPGMDIDVWKANHHGSCNGVSVEYLDQMTPKFVVIGVASDNPYGHVHEQTKALLRSRNIPWYRTDENGTITIRVLPDSGALWSITAQRGQPSLSGKSDFKSLQVICETMRNPRRR